MQSLLRSLAINTTSEASKLIAKKNKLINFKRTNYLIVLFILALNIITVNSIGQTVVTFTTSGANTFIAPPGVSSVIVECWGGGGAGGGGNTVSGGGGGGGAYRKTLNVPVVAGTSYTITVGAGGIGTTGTGPTGGVSSAVLGSTVTANGGAGGANGAPGAGGAGGTGGTFNGGAGAAGVNFGYGGGGGGSAGTGSNGNTATSGSGAAAVTGGAAGGNGGSPGLAGGQPGGGGGGAIGFGSQTGGSGGNGQVKITYTPAPPTISGLSASSGCVGSAVTITGTNFQQPISGTGITVTGTNGTIIKFNGTTQSAYTVNSAGTAITTTVPTGATSGTITVQTSGGTATSSSFTVTSATASGISPTSGQGGTSITISGSNLTGATNVKFGSLAATTFTVSSATSITAVAPANVATGSVTFVDACGATITAGTFTVPATKLVITSISPASPAAGSAFSVTVQAQNDNGIATNVTAATAISLSTNGNAGSLSGTTTGTIAAGSNSVIISGVLFTQAGTNVTITATRTSGDNLTAGTSAPFTVTAYVSAASDYFRTQATGNWNANSTWQSSPNNTTWYPASATPTSAANTITIQTTHIVTVTADVSVDQVILLGTGNITVNSGIRLTIASGPTATDLDITAGSVVVNGFLRLENTAVIASSSSTLNIGATGTYEHNYTTATGTIPTATWSTGSTCKIIGYTSNNSTPGGLGQNFKNFAWSCTSQTANINLSGTLITVAETFSVSSTGSGSLRLVGNTPPLAMSIGNYSQTGGAVNTSNGSASPTLTVSGDVSVSGGTLQTSGSGTNGTFIFSSANIHTVTFATPSNITNINFTVNSGATMKLGSDIALSRYGTSSPQFKGTILVNSGGIFDASTFVVSAQGSGGGTGTNSAVFTLNSGAKIITANATGVQGSINTTNLTTTLSSGADYEFQGAATGVFTTTTANTVNNLIINNTLGTVTNSQPLNVTGTLNLTSGIFNTTTTNTLTLAASAVLGTNAGSATSFINGPLNRTLPASISATTVYAFPVGSGTTYLPYSLISVTGASPVLQVTAFATNSAGTADGTTLKTISTSEYWQTKVISGTYSGGALSLGRQASLGSFNVIGKGASTNSAASAYSSIGGTIGTLSGVNSVNNSSSTGAIAVSASQFNVLAQAAYAITSSAGANGTISPSGTIYVGYNGSQSYTIAPAACYSIADVLVDGVSVGAVSTYTFTNTTASHTISASFVIRTYTISATSGANGTVTPVGVSTVNCGSNNTYTIAPAACYSIADVLVDGVSVGAVSTYTFTNTTASHTISASFVIRTYTISATSGANGTVTPVGVSTVNCGSNNTYIITPAACYSIANVLVDGVSVGAVSTYTFTNTTANHTISASFAINTYTITATSGANGTVTPPGVSTVNCGSNNTYIITPAACYSIANVLVDGVSVGAVSTYTFTNTTASHTISASFAINTYTITATSGANGTVTPPGVSTVNCGSNNTYTITPASCYSIADVLVDGSSVGAVSTYTFTNTTASHTISASFAINTYTITATSGANGTVTPSGTATVNCGSNNTYTITPAACYSIADVLVDGVSNAGAINTGSYTFSNVQANHTISATFMNLDTWIAGAGDWNTSSNWSCGIPTATTNVIIPAGGFPEIFAPAVNSVHNITINTGASLTLDYSGSDTAVLTITGAYTNSGILANNGKIVLNGDVAQSFPGGSVSNPLMNTLEINNTLGVSADRSFTIRGKLFPTTGTLALGASYITLKSDSSNVAGTPEYNTARVGVVGTGASFTYGTGRFVIERYFHSKRAWRLITAPIAKLSSPTIYNSWQLGGRTTTTPAAQGGPAPAGSGVLITGPTPTGPGIDPGVNSQYSLKTYNSFSGALVPVANTQLPLLSPGTPGSTADNIGYFNFVRGDRNPALVGAFSTATDTTTLRDTGRIQIHDQTFTFPLAGGTGDKFILLANPYASPIDFSAIYLANSSTIQDKFWAWDPSSNQPVGSYVEVFGDGFGGNYTVVPTSLGGQTQYIQSCQAVYVQTTNASTASVIIKEDFKSDATVKKPLFRPLIFTTAQLATNLKFLNADNTTALADGVLAQFSSSFSNAVDQQDGLKFPNVNESFAVAREGRLLTVERRNLLTQSDTLFFNLTKAGQRSYQLEFVAEGIEGFTGFLEDSYLKTSTPVSLTGITTVNFTINAEAASAAANRFRLVFRPAAPLPVTFTKVKAYQQGSSINVEWMVNNELNMQAYELERSADGSHFTKIATAAALQNNGRQASYTTPDAAPFNGVNYYRIHSISRSGEDLYSNVVKVTIGRGAPQISVYPNPIVNGTINLQLTNQPEGSYGVKLLNKLGQVLITKEITHAAGSSTETLQLSKAMAHGIYQLEVTSPGKIKKNINVSY